VLDDGKKGAHIARMILSCLLRTARSWMERRAAQQGVEADEAEHDGASQLNSSVGRTWRSDPSLISRAGGAA
jgi:hypothetical protein